MFSCYGCLSLLSCYSFDVYSKHKLDLCIWEHNNHLLSNKWPYQKGLFSKIMCGKKKIGSQSSLKFENVTLSGSGSFYSQESMKCNCTTATECFKQNAKCCWLLNPGTPPATPLSPNCLAAFHNEHHMCKWMDKGPREAGSDKWLQWQQQWLASLLLK